MSQKSDIKSFSTSIKSFCKELEGCREHRILNCSSSYTKDIAFACLTCDKVISSQFQELWGNGMPLFFKNFYNKFVYPMKTLSGKDLGNKMFELIELNNKEIEKYDRLKNLI